MEISDVVRTPLAFHGIIVGFVVILAVLVFVFGFKTAEEPPFDKLTNSGDDRKPAGKKRKVKDKKSQSNGHVTTVQNDKSDSKQKSGDGAKTSTPKAGHKNVKDEKGEGDKNKVKDASKSSGKQDKKQQKIEVVVKSALKENKDNKENKSEQKSAKKNDQLNKDVKKQGNKNKGKENVAVEVKNKKNTAKSSQKSKKADEKPVDFDDGEWEQACYRKDKKKNRILNAEEVSSGDKTGGKKEASSPGKKKSNKTPLASVVETAESNIEKKPAKKEATKKEKAKNIQPTEEAPEPAADITIDKTPAKKNKKKSGKEDAENIGANEKDIIETVAKVTEAVTAPTTAVPEPANKVMEDNIAFDDFADSCPEKWKEPKTSKKSNNRKKVRKDQ